jgi:hypothetical protein
LRACGYLRLRFVHGILLVLVAVIGRVRGLAALVFVLLSACSELKGGSSTTATSLATLGPVTVSDEFSIGEPAYRDGLAHRARIASGPRGYLATYTLSSGTIFPPPEYAAVATRIDPNGETLDRFGIVLGSEREHTGLDMQPVARWAGSAWLVFWAEGAGALACARLLENGMVERPNASLGADMVPRDAAFDGSRALVLGHDGRIVLVDALCNRVSDPVAVVPSNYLSTWRTNTAFDGSNFLVAYTTRALGSPDAFVVHGVSTSGALVGDPIVVATASWVRTTAPGGDVIGIEGHIASQSGRTIAAYLRRPYPSAPAGDPAYRTLDGETLGVEHTLLSAAGIVLEAAPVGDGFVLSGFLREDPNRLVLATIRPDGTEATRLTSLPGFTTPGDLHAASRGSDIVVSSGSNAWLYRSDLSLASGPNRIATHASSQSNSSAAGTADVRWVVWREDLFGIYGARIAQGGTILDPEPKPIFTGPNTNVPLASVASNGTDFLVAASLPRSGGSVRVEVKRLFSDGRVDPSSVTLDTSGYNLPRIATDGSGYLVVWGHLDSPERLLAARVTSGGEVLDSPPLVIADFGPFSNVFYAVAYDGSDYVVAFSPEGGTYSRRVGRDGSLSDLQSHGPGIVTGLAWGTDKGLITLVTNTAHVASWLPERGAPPDDDRVDIPLPGLGVDGYPRSLAWDGTSFWTTWTDGRRGLVGVRAGLAVYGADAYAARITPNDKGHETTEILLASGMTYPSPFLTHSIAAAPGNAVAVYDTWDERHGFRAVRLRGRVLTNEGSDGGEGGAGGVGGSAGQSGRGGTSGAAAGTTGSGGDGGQDGGDAGHGAGDGGSDAGDGGSRPDQGGASGRAGGAGAPKSSDGSGSGSDEACSCRVVGMVPTGGTPLTFVLVGLTLAFARFGSSRERFRRAARNGRLW